MIYVEEKRGRKQRGKDEYSHFKQQGSVFFNMVMLKITDAFYMCMHKRRRSSVMYMRIACYKAVLMNQFIVWILNSML